METVRVVFVGHMDHGKSTLIGRLLFDSGFLKPEKIQEIKEKSKELGKDVEYCFALDSFSEERENGLTIDLTRAPFKGEKYEYQIIDCPGHQEFVKNMISGASQAEAAVLLVSAKEGVEQQTKRHAYLLNFLGIKQIFVAVNKMDLVGYSQERFEEIKREVKSFISSFGFDCSSLIFIPISAKLGENVFNKSENLNWYKKTLIQTLDDNVKPADKNILSSFRMPVQDVLDIDSESYILGSLVSGGVKLNDKISLSPSGVHGEIVGIRDFSQELSEALSGQSIAVRINGRKVDSSLIGNVMYSGLPVKMSNNLTSQIIIFPENRIHKNDKLTFRIGTDCCNGTINKFLSKINTSSGEITRENIDMLTSDEAGIVL